MAGVRVARATQRSCLVRVSPRVGLGQRAIAILRHVARGRGSAPPRWLQ